MREIKVNFATNAAFPRHDNTSNGCVFLFTALVVIYFYFKHKHRQKTIRLSVKKLLFSHAHSM